MLPDKKKIIILRAAIIAFYAACIFFIALILIANPLINDIYGGFSHDKRFFHCPACGATRALYCLLTFNFKGAFYYHAYLTVLFPVFAYVLLTLTVNLFFGRKIIPYPKNFPFYLYALLSLLLVFTVARNLTTVIY